MPEQELELKEVPEDGKKTKKLLILGGIGLVLVLLIGGGLWFFMGSDEPAPTALNADTQAQAEAATVSAEEAEYVGMPKPFLFNLPGVNRSRLVEIKVQLMVRGEDDSVLTRKHIPLIEAALLTTFSGADVQHLSTQAGKDELRQLALLNVQNTLQPITGKRIVEKVLFTGFVMQ